MKDSSPPCMKMYPWHLVAPGGCPPLGPGSEVVFGTFEIQRAQRRPRLVLTNMDIRWLGPLRSTSVSVYRIHFSTFRQKSGKVLLTLKLDPLFLHFSRRRCAPAPKNSAFFSAGAAHQHPKNRWQFFSPALRAGTKKQVAFFSPALRAGKMR